MEFENVQHTTFLVPVHILFILILHGRHIMYFLTSEFFELVVSVLHANICWR